LIVNWTNINWRLLAILISVRNDWIYVGRIYWINWLNLSWINWLNVSVDWNYLGLDWTNINFHRG